MNDIDVAGTMAKPRADWQARVEELCKPENFRAYVLSGLYNELSGEERMHLRHHLNLVEEWAKYMAAGMLKGVLKYDTQQRPVEQWMAHMVGEGADQSCYQMLLFDEWRKHE